MAVKHHSTVWIQTVDDTEAFVLSTDGATEFGEYRGNGSPNGVVTANQGSTYHDTSGSFWLKTTGSGDTGWQEIGAGVSDTSITTGTLGTAGDNRTANFGGSNSLTLTNMTTFDVSASSDITLSTTAGEADVVSTAFNVKNASAIGGILRLYDTDDSNFVGIESPGTIATNYTMRLPDAAPTANGQVMAFTTSGVASFTSVGTGGMDFKGAWDASSGAFPDASPNSKGDYYKVTVAGTQDSVAFAVGDTLIAEVDSASTSTYTGNWFKVDNTDVVTSVHGRIGAVIGVLDDYQADLITNTPTGFTTGTEVQTAIDEIVTEVEKSASHSQTYGNGVLTTFTITHNLNTEQVHVTCKEEGGDENVIYPTIKTFLANSFVIEHSVAPSTDEFRVTVTKVLRP